MSALTGNRDTKEILCGGIRFSRRLPLEENAVIHLGAIAAVNSSGNAVPASDTAGLTVAGICEAAADGKVQLKTGVFLVDNGTAGEALTRSDIGKTAYVLDDHTVGKAGGSYRIAAGIVQDVGTDGVSVEIGNGPVPIVPAPCAWQPEVVTADPAAASASNFGNAIVVGGSGWVSGTAIATGTAGEIYMSNGSSWVKLG